jgi:hypothetical protein
VVLKTLCANVEALYEVEGGSCDRHDTEPFIIQVATFLPP